MSKTDKINDKNDRENLKNDAVELRESGKLAEALEVFESIEKWDKLNNNPPGQIDVLGHIRITYSRIAEGSSDEEEVTHSRKKALEVTEKAGKLLKQSPNISEGAKLIHLVHLASARADLAVESSFDVKQAMLHVSLDEIEEALKKFPGSRAHKAWPSNTKARIQMEMDDYEGAIRTLTLAEQWIFEGYDQEITNGDQANIKISIWLSGLQLTKAKLCINTGKKDLARYYAQCIVSTDDEYLEERRKEARRILELC